MTRRAGVFSLALLLAAVAVPVSAFAHTGMGHAAGFADGFSHPIDGFDHILLVFAVGIWAARSATRGAFAGAFIAAALFSVFHGIMAGEAGGSSYVAGIVAATAVLNACGAGAGLALKFKRFDRFFLARNAGPVLAAIGAILLFV